jgi:enoyl-CoA hydratase/carnithine racemase
VVMGGGMGLAQGAKLRIATERTKMAMPETLIGLFPDVGGGYFLSRCQGALGEYLGLTGYMLNGAEAVFAGLADVLVDSASLNAMWTQLPALHWSQPDSLKTFTRSFQTTTPQDTLSWWTDSLNQAFSAPDLQSIASALKASNNQHALEALHKRSPLMLAVTLEHIRRARHMHLRTGHGAPQFPPTAFAPHTCAKRHGRGYSCPGGGQRPCATLVACAYR